jgi:hypothetical protein
MLRVVAKGMFIRHTPYWLVKWGKHILRIKSESSICLPIFQLFFIYVLI